MYIHIVIHVHVYMMFISVIYTPFIMMFCIKPRLFITYYCMFTPHPLMFSVQYPVYITDMIPDITDMITDLC